MADLRWFTERYEQKLGRRYETFAAAIGRYADGEPNVIVETGCMLRDAWENGNSTRVFLDVLAHYGGRLFTCDISPGYMAECIKMNDTLPPGWWFPIVSDSVRFLKSLRFPIDLLYLDSMDYPAYRVGQVDFADLICGLPESHQSPVRSLILKILDGAGTGADGLVCNYEALSANMIALAQSHNVAELVAAWPNLHAGSVVLIDDADLDDGGKPCLSRKFLTDNGWQCVAESQQTLWIPGERNGESEEEDGSETHSPKAGKGATGS